MMWKEWTMKDCLPNVELKDYNVMTDEKNFFDQPVKNNKQRMRKS